MRHIYIAIVYTSLVELSDDQVEKRQPLKELTTPCISSGRAIPVAIHDNFVSQTIEHCRFHEAFVPYKGTHVDV